MIKIVFMCLGGFSTSFLEQKTSEAFQKAGIEAEIKACSAATIDNISEDVDVILLAPQISYMKDELTKECEKKGILFTDIPFEIYGQMDGEGILKIVSDLLKQKK